jgi:hypothetical protein
MQPPSIHVDLRCDPGSSRRPTECWIGSVIGEEALTGLRAVLRTLVSAVPPDGSTAVSLVSLRRRHPRGAPGRILAPRRLTHQIGAPARAP